MDKVELEALAELLATGSDGPWEVAEQAIRTVEPGRCIARADWEIRDHIDDENLAAIVASVNFLRDNLPAIIEQRAEIERLRNYHKAVEQMVCVWSGTDRPSSFDESAWYDSDGDDERWQQFIEARAALNPTGQPA